jgi:hypothetical protein
MTTFEPGPATPGPTTPLIPIKPKAKRGGGGELLLGLAAVVAAAGIAFAAGRLTAPPSAAANGGTNGRNFGGGPASSFVPNGSFQPGQGGFGGRGSALSVEGTVTAVGTGSITIQTATGAQTTVATSGTTTYHRQGAATAADAAVGTKVLVQVTGFGGLGRGGANASPGTGPAASGAPDGASASASDITIVSP